MHYYSIIVLEMYSTPVPLFWIKTIAELGGKTVSDSFSIILNILKTLESTSCIGNISCSKMWASCVVEFRKEYSHILCAYYNLFVERLLGDIKKPW